MCCQCWGMCWGIELFKIQSRHRFGQPSSPNVSESSLAVWAAVLGFAALTLMPKALIHNSPWRSQTALPEFSEHKPQHLYSENAILLCHFALDRVHRRMREKWEKWDAWLQVSFVLWCTFCYRYNRTTRNTAFHNLFLSYNRGYIIIRQSDNQINQLNDICLSWASIANVELSLDIFRSVFENVF